MHFNSKAEQTDGNDQFCPHLDKTNKNINAVLHDVLAGKYSLKVGKVPPIKQYTRNWNQSIS